MSNVISPMSGVPVSTLESRLSTGTFGSDKIGLPSLPTIRSGRRYGPAVLLACGVLGGAGAATAMGTGEAAAPQNVVAQPTVLDFTATTTGFGRVESRSSGNLKALTDSRGRTLVRFHMARGLSAAQEAGCVDAPDGKAFKNSYVDSRGRTVWFNDKFKAGEEICRTADGKTRLGNINEDIECGNEISFKQKKVVPEASLNVVRSFKGWVRAKGSTVAIATSRIEAKAVCATANTSASSQLEGYGKATASTNVEVAVRQKQRAKLAVNGIRAAGARVLTENSEVSRITHEAQSSAAVELNGKVTVHCAEMGLPPTVVDLCPNYDGVQTSIPVGSLLGPDGMCGKDPNIGGETPPVDAPGNNSPNDPNTPAPSECFGPDGQPVARGTENAICEA